MSISSAFIFLIVLFTLSSSGDLPSYIPRCDLNDSELSTCVKKAFNTLRPYVQKGIDEIRLPSLMPLVFSSFKIQQESLTANYTGAVKNFTIHGLENYNLIDFRYDNQTKTFYGNFEFSPLTINTVYEVKGELFHIPVVGSDVFDGNLGPLNASFEINGELVKHKGAEYYRPKKVQVRLSIENSAYNFHNLFNNKDLSRMTNEMLNRNSKLVTEAVTPVYERLFEIAIMRYVQTLTKLYPYYKLFPYSK